VCKWENNETENANKKMTQAAANGASPPIERGMIARQVVTSLQVMTTVQHNMT
jgi:hypothetical protein